MSPLQAAALGGMGQMNTAQGLSAAKIGAGSFDSARLAASADSSQAVATSATSLATPPNAVPSTSAPASSILNHKVEQTANSLASLRVQVSSPNSPLRARLELLETQFRQVGTNIRATGEQTSPMQLLKLQHEIYQVGEEVELLSKVVEQTTTGLKSVLQMQI